MKRDNIYDAIFQVNLNNSKIKKFRDDDLKDFARKIEKI